MKVSEALEDPNDPNSEWIISFEFDDTEEDQNLLKILTAGAKAKDVPIEQYLIEIITTNALKEINEKKKSKKKAKKKK